MITASAITTLRSLGAGSALFLLATAGFFLPVARAQDMSPADRLKELGLETTEVGRVTAHFAPADRQRAEELAALTEEAAAFVEAELGLAFDLGMAALAPEHWFSDIPGLPYAIPWPSMPDRLIFMPSSLEEGLLIQGPTALDDRRRVDFVLLHEFGHIAAKEYFRPADDQDYLPVKWFEELLATYFAYAFVHATDAAWAEAAGSAWTEEVQRFTPSVLSLDWSFMNALPGDELARTYAWYQFMLNLRAAEIYDAHGLGFVRALKENLPWAESTAWTTTTLLPLIDKVAPGFETWAASLPHAYGKSEDGP